MSIVRIDEEIQPLKYLVITQEKDPESVVTTNVVISDNRLNKINLISIERGPKGDTGATGPIGLPGKDGVTFDVLPITSGGTNNTNFSSGNIIYYDGYKLSSSNFNLTDLANGSLNGSAITGVFAGSGLYRELTDNSVSLAINPGEGLFINESNQIAIDDTIVRKVELNLGSIDGVVPISKGGTNNQTFSSNRLLYYDGFKISSFPLATGRILLSGTTIDIVAGSGLTGGGSLSIPSGSVVLNIGESSDILVENNSISLSTTGNAGTYTKITTDTKGRVVSGSNLTYSDIINILGYTPWHRDNDGADSGLDADLLDGLNSDYFLNLSNHTGIISPDNLPIQTTPGLFTKVQVNDKGIVVNGQDNNYFDIVNALGYRPVCATGDTINGPITINGNVDLNSDILNIRDNLPTFGTNTSSILPSEPRGFSFLYGGYTQRTGILAFYPAEKELRLITNISSTGEINGGPSDNAFRDDIDGGNADAVYVVGGLTGDMNVVLLRAVADSLYVSRINAQTISGSKTFAQPLTVNNQITIVPSINQSTPPLNVASNTGMVPNLNVDLLHGHDGDYYTNAGNMTGLFDYEKVQFNNLEGTPGYLAIFDNRTTNPSRTISDSYIQQTSNFVKVTNNYNFSVGNNSGNSFTSRSVGIGSNNRILGNNSLAVGNSNLIESDNSVALNYGSKTFSNTSIAAGSYGYSWSTNQFSFGAFADFEGTSQISQGQYSTVALGLNRNETNGSWVSMSPVIYIPKDKTIAYSLEVLINKAAGPNAALTIFSSGIIKNSTYRDPNNLSSTLNTSAILRYPNKTEIYNDSQQRRHFYHYKLDNNTIIQNLEVSAPPLKTFAEVAQNTESVYKFIPQFITANGSYYKTNDGSMILDINKPISSGWSIQNSGSPKINIKSYYHGMATGCLANIVFVSGSHHRPVSRPYEVVEIIDKNHFVINENSWKGYLTGNQIIIDPDDITSFNNSNKFTINGGYVYTNSPDIYNIPSNILGVIQAGMKVSFGPYPWLYSNSLTQTGIVVNVTSNSVTLDTPFTGLAYTPGPNTINSPGFITFENYSEHVLDSQALYLTIDGYGQQPIVSISGAYPIEYCSRPTLGIRVSGIAPIFSGIPVKVSPAVTNSCSLIVNPKRNIDGTYSRSAAVFTKYNGIYTIYPSISGTSDISIYNRQLEDIKLPSVPFTYSFCCGYGDDDNSLFEIQKFGINSYLKFKKNPIVVSDIGDGLLHSSAATGIILNKEYIFGPDAPSPFAINTSYYGIPIDNNTFQLAKSLSGEPIVLDNTTQYISYNLWSNTLDYETKKKYTVRIKVTDKSGRSIEQSFGINIDDVNENPFLLNPIPDQVTIVDELFSFAIPQNTFADFDSEDSITYSCSLTNSNPLPPWLSFDAESGSFSGVPSSGDIGTLDIKVIASDTGSLYIEDNFSINIAENIAQSLGYLTTVTQTQKLRQITLDNSHIIENSYDGTIGKLDVDGGYRPYFIFSSASNSFLGTMIDGSKALTECFPKTSSYPTTTILGSISSLVSGLALSSSVVGFPNQSTIDTIISPTSFSAIVTSGSNVISITDSNLQNILYSGTRLFSSLSGWDNLNIRAQSVTADTIIVNLPFSGKYENPASCSLYTSGNTVVLSAPATATNYAIEAVHTVPIPASGQYYVDYLKTFNTTEELGWCPTNYTVINTKGFDTQTREYSQSTGYYATGSISFYTDYGFNKINILPITDINIESNENSIYLNYIDSNNGIIPIDGPYPTISGDDFTRNFIVDNTCLFPDIVPASTGAVKINLDQNHGYQITNSTIINQVPIKFTSTINNNSNRIPKNNLFDIITINGNKITVKDSQNYLLKENNRPDYFEQPIRASYSTNGFAFTGTFVHNSYRVFDLTLSNSSSPIWSSEYILEPNNLIASNDQRLPAGARFVDFQNGFYFNGLIGKNTNILSYCDSLPGTIYPNSVMSVFNDTIPNWPPEGIEINFSGLNTTPYRLIESSNNISVTGNGTESDPYEISCGSGNEQILSSKLLLMGCDGQQINISGSVGCYPGSYFNISQVSPTTNSAQVLFSFTNPYNHPDNFNLDGTPNNRIISSGINISITGWPKDTIVISTHRENISGPISHAIFNVFSYVTYSFAGAKYKLDLSTNVPNFGGDSLASTFYIKPVMTLTEKTCLNGLTKANNRKLFFNGSIVRINNLSTPRSYLNINDQLKIINFNDNTNFNSSLISQYVQVVGTGTNNTSITGIITNGPRIIPPKHSNPNDPYKGNEFRFADSLGLAYNEELPNSGTLSFLGAVSGLCTMPYFNNIYYHSYGGITASWPADIDGKYLSYPQTGIYSISSNASTCSSGTMCLSIKGFAGTIFNNIPDSVNRLNIGKTSNISKTTDGFGYTRPWGTDKKLYFDFSDGAPELNGSYYIADKIDPQTLTLNIPYNANYLNRSGLVILVDSNFNMKANRHPNINNSFYTSNGLLSVSGTDNSLFDFSIDGYNDSSKRWKHLVHLNNYTNTFYSGYNATIHNQIGVQLLYLNPDVIRIDTIEYSFDFGYSYTLVTEEENDTIFVKSTDTQPIYLKVKIKDGASKWSSTITKSAPKINIFGISDYAIDSDNILYNHFDKSWTINIIVNSFVSILNNRTITITASDETGSYSKDILLDIFKKPDILSPLAAYVHENDIANWSLVYYIDNLPDPPNITMDNFPGNNYTIINEQFTNSNNIKILSGPPGSITGTFHPVLYVKDYITNEILASHTGVINVIPANTAKPIYSLSPIKLDEDIYLNITNNNSASFNFYIPAINAVETNLIVSLSNDNNYSYSVTPEYSTVSNTYKVTVQIQGLTGYYPNKNISISLNQPQETSTGELEWINYTFNKVVNLTLYKNFEVNTFEIIQPLVYDKEEQWSIQFHLKDGILSHRSDIEPKVRLFNLPTIGTYENQPLEYSITYQHDDINKRWHVVAIGKKDVFGNNTDALGLRTIQIYAEDGINSASNTVDVLFNQTRYLDNVQPTIFATENQPYQSTIDIKQASSGSVPNVSIPDSLRENTIYLNKYYNRYDKDLKTWELSYLGDSITEKWDVQLVYNNINNVLNSSQKSSITVQCKGIATDKIQAIGKLDLIELDSVALTSLPIKVTNVTYPYYSAVEGSEWEIEFSTILGLESPNFPPTISFSGLPSVCSGYDPKLPLEQQSSCFVSRTWDPGGKKWNFKFKGIPLCGIEGLKPFTITAIDTDTLQNTYLTADTAPASILYTSLLDNGMPHPPPDIKFMGMSEPNPIALYPLCNTPLSPISYRFGPASRNICPIPTGITGWMVSGVNGYSLLPPGIEYTISFPGGNPMPPWNNLSSGVLTIYGNPTDFAGGGQYPQELNLIVFDARNKSTKKTIKFTDASSSNPPSPMDITVYFDREKPSYTERRAVNQGEPAQPLGTRAIDSLRYSNIYTLRPPADPIALDCTSRLPHNQCQTSPIQYTGADYFSGDFKVYITFVRGGLPNISIQAGQLMYFEFDNTAYNGKYTLQQLNINGTVIFYIDIPGHDLTTGTGRVVRQLDPLLPSVNLQFFNGSLDINTTKSILGCGVFSSKLQYPYNSPDDTNGYGIFGRMRPSYIASLPPNGVFSSQDNVLYSLPITPLNNIYNQNSSQLDVIKTSNCWETGYLRVSGIILPAPIVELTDPAPASEAPFSYNGQQYFIGSRCVFGNTSEQRNIAANQRLVNINYRLKNMMNNYVYASSSVGPNSAISFVNNESSGTVLSLFISNNPSVFPTYKPDAIRYAENEYFWVHKGGTKNQTLTQSSFPPVVIAKTTPISCLSGVPISGYGGFAVGGYIPFNEYSIAIPYYQLSDGTNWITQQYPPHMSGTIQQEITAPSIQLPYSHPGYTNQNNQYISIFSDNNFIIDDIIYVQFDNSSLPSTTLALDNNNYIDGTIKIPFNRSNQQPVNGTAVITYKNLITNISGNEITIKHKNIPYNIGDSIDIISTAASTLLNTMPYNYTTNIVSGDASYLVAEFSGPTDTSYASGLSISGVCDIFKNYHNQINISNITNIREGYWSFSLSGTPTGLYKDYRYKFMSVENTGMPIFSLPSFYPKKYSTTQPLYVTKPLKIILSQSVIDNGVTNNNGVWSLSFNIDGGNRPVYNNFPEIMLNNNMCNFNRQVSPSTMLDTYNSTTDTLIVTITNNNNYDWRYDTSFDLLVFDETGSDTKTINFNQTQ